jgi:dienelactone hydrolase
VKPLFLLSARPTVSVSLRHVIALLILIPTSAKSQSAYPPASEVKAAFVKMLDRPKVPLDVKIIETKSIDNGLVVERLDFASQKRPDGGIERVPTLLVRPSERSTRRPVVIALHGTGGTKDGMRSWLSELARKGIIGVAIDARFHGDRAGGARGSAAYVKAITESWRTKPGDPQSHPFYYDTCWDLWRTVDYLQTRDDVDANRIGMIGISMGGIETWLAAAVDDRVKVAVPAIGVQSFRWSLENGHWQGRARTIGGAHDAAANDLGKQKVDAEVCRALWNKVIPGMLDQFDCPSMLRLFADRSLLIVNGEKDQNCPIDGAKVAFASARAAFDRAGKSDHLKIMVAEGKGHEVTPEQHKAAIDWFVKWLEPTK